MTSRALLPLTRLTGWLSLVIGLCAAAGCTEAPGTEPPASTDGSGSSDQDTEGELPQTPETVQDFVSADVDKPLSCPGGPHCECKSSAECDSGLCLDEPSGKKCAQACSGTCDGDYKCALFQEPGSDVSQVCVPRWGFVCEPCETSAGCIAPGFGEGTAACVDYGKGNGRFCSVPCASAEECPTGYGCEQATTAEGKTTQLCVRKPAADGTIDCPCDARATALQLTTPCQATSDKGTCLGKRSCGPQGLSACIAPPIGKDVCDGLDNDCNGTIDDLACDDGNACTEDKCSAKEQTCAHLDTPGGCDDGDACTSGDVCQSGKCAGKTVECDDKNPCTKDSCDLASGCTSTAIEAGCDDGSPCTVGDACSGGQCVPGTAKDCDDKNACTQDACDLQTGACKNQALDGQPCSDGNACSGPDLCAVDVCKGQLIDCDDKNPCTDDTCDPTTGCVHKPTVKPCNDFNACTQNDLCDGKGACMGTGIDVGQACGDNNPCTTDSCDQAQGCVHSPQAGPCEDGNPCTNGDTCTAGQCKPGENLCSCTSDDDCKGKEDKNLCNGTLFCDKSKGLYTCAVDPKTIVSCDTQGDTACKKTTCQPATGQCLASSEPDGKACDADGSVCTQNDACLGGTCTAGAKLDCDDKNPCTDDTCDGKTGCKPVANIGACSDGNACTTGDTCGAGLCVPGKKLVCDDGSACSADSCDPKTGLCVYDGSGFEGDPCDADGSVCTVADKCGGGKCVAGGKKLCDDQNPCTNDTCDAKSGCVFLNNVEPCDFDGNPCTPFDACKNGLCSPGGKKDCDDKNACTIDVCDTKTGECKHVADPLEDASCDDGNACTKNDSCKSGTCKGGLPVSCDDGEQCTKDSCEPVKGCVIAITADGTACNDGNACTLNDICVQAKCAGVKLDCDDKNSCTTDACGSTGCTHTNVTDATACGTAGQHCVKGLCVTAGCGDGYVASGEVCDDGNKANCDGCESCQPRGVLTLDGKSYGALAIDAGPAGSYKGLVGTGGDLTLEAWVKPDNLANDMVILSKAKLADNGPAAYTLGVQAGSGKPFFYHKNLDAGELVLGTLGVTAGQWSHVAVTVAGDEVRLFVGGAPAGKATLKQLRVDAQGVAVQLGRRYADAEGGAFVGSLDAVHVAATALYGGAFVPARTPAVVPGTRALWLFDDGKGTDSGPYGQTLQLTGGAFAKDACYGLPADAGVCGDGKVASYETCDDGNAEACDGCEGCRAQTVLDAGQGQIVATPPIGTWAADAFCPGCTVTIEAWVKLTSQAGVGQILGSSCTTLSVNYQNGIFGAYRSLTPTPLKGSVSPSVGKWYHLAAVISWGKGGTSRLYVDGKLQPFTVGGQPKTLPEGGVETFDGPPELLTEILYIGAGGASPTECDPPKSDLPFPGVIDEVRISAGSRYYDDFLPQRRLFPDKQTRGLWHFDAGATPGLDDSGQAVAAKSSAATLPPDACYGEQKTAVRCGDAVAARWEACDKGTGNGLPPATCSATCLPNGDTDCGGLTWTGQPQYATGSNVLVYPNTQNAFTGFTVEGWARLPAYPTAPVGVIAGIDAPPVCSGQVWYVGVGPGGLDASSLGSGTASEAKKVWKLKTWQHFALQFHGAGKGSLYVDGVKVRDFTGVVANWKSTCGLKLGNSQATLDSTPTTPLAADLASLALSKKVRYGQPFTPVWKLAADSDHHFVFPLDEGSGIESASIGGTYKVTLKTATTWLKGTGPGCW